MAKSRNIKGFGKVDAKRAAGIQFEGVQELTRKLEAAGTLATGALASAMFLEQEAIMAKSKEKTPVDTGVLRASGTVLPPEQKGSKIEVVSGYGGAAAGYAIAVHEKTDQQHVTGEAKFLERSFLERSPKIPANLAKRVEAAWQRLRVR